MSKGCFGSVICNNPKSEVCVSCALRKPCFQEAKATLGKITKRSEIDTLQKQRQHAQIEVEESPPTSFVAVPQSSRREPLTEYQRHFMQNDRIPVKVRKLAGAVFRKGMTEKYLRNILSAGINPFNNSTPAIMDITCDLIIGDKLSKPLLRQEFQRAGQSDKTALAQANIVITMLRLMNVIGEDLKIKEVK